MLVDLRQPFRKLVDQVVDRVRQSHIDQRTVWKGPRDLAPEARVEPVVVVHVQKAAPRQVLAQPSDLHVAELDVAVTGCVDERIVP